VARNLLRQQAATGRRRRLLADRIAALTSKADLTAWDAGEHVVERAAALDALASLPEPDVEVLTLVTWHGLDVRAAAQVVGCSPPAFTVRLHRARRRLAAALEAAEQAEKLPGHHPAAGRPRPAIAPGQPSPSTLKEHA
jgi:RNA polymerase sigma-70 factor (ECF subfamily)